MKLWRFELKKLLFTQRGLLILAVCLSLKSLTLALLPELKDERIRMSRKQYDKYLTRLYGANTPEKSDFILGEYADCRAVMAMQEDMREKYREGELGEEEWHAYCERLDGACLREHAAEIFAEKAELFAAQDESLPPAHYIYEYGWQTVFSAQLFPDIFLLFGLLFLTARFFPAEEAEGMLPVLLASQKGRRPLFLAKLSALLILCGGGAFLAALGEAAVFWRRGFLTDGGAPLYSVSLFAENCRLRISLWQAYVISLSVRSLAAILFVLFFYGISVRLRHAAYLIFLALCALVFPLFLPLSPILLFTHGGLLSGSRMLRLWGGWGGSLLLPLGAVALYSCVALFAAPAEFRGGFRRSGFRKNFRKNVPQNVPKN